MRGRSAHAGTTPMELRRDAGLIAAKINVHMHEMVASARYGMGMRCTMGRVSPVPNRVNIVPGRVVCTVDLRNPVDALMEQAEADLSTYLDHLEKEHGVRIERRYTARTASVAFDPEVVTKVKAAISALGYTHREILSGAGHDAQEMASVCPTAMIFVPGEYDGISHNPGSSRPPRRAPGASRRCCTP
jgi:N-carbamoyl-L-amino-acid hydrolase